MKTILLFVLFNLLVKCTPVPFDPPINNNYSKYCIAIQPFDEFKYEELESIKREILSFFKGEVIILEPKSIPRSYYISQIGQYFADSILAYLSVNHAKRINEMVGITHQNICTLKENKSKDLPAYFDQGIFGLGYQPGNSCIISDFKLRSEDFSVYSLRMRNVIFHEIGHNMDLPHCYNNNCIMSENAGNLPVLSMNRLHLCEECKKKLNE